MFFTNFSEVIGEVPMKMFRILALVFVLAVSVTACRKSEIRPHKCGGAEKTEQTETAPVNGRVGTSSIYQDESVETGEYMVNDIVGSGDDDRDGGDKKAKAGAGR
jgi:hypothetical protein